MRKIKEKIIAEAKAAMIFIAMIPVIAGMIGLIGLLASFEPTESMSVTAAANHKLCCAIPTTNWDQFYQEERVRALGLDHYDVLEDYYGIFDESRAN